MNQEVQNAKIKNLISVCKETGNTKKLAVVSFILTSNKLEEIGIKIGLRPRKKDFNEKLFEYMEFINQFFEKNIGLDIFPPGQVETLQQCELLFLQNKGDMPYDYIKIMFSIYYELVKLQIPDLNKSINDGNYRHNSQLGLYSFLSPNSSKQTRKGDELKPLILQKIKEKQRFVQSQLKEEFSSHTFEDAIYLQTLQRSIEQKNKGKIIVEGTLKDNFLYHQSIEEIFRYLMIGLIVLFFSLGIIILVEMTHFPALSLSGWTVILFGVAATLFFIYIKFFRRR